MYKKIALFLICSLLAGAVQAGPGPGRFARKKFAGKKQAVTNTLEKRAWNSYSKALRKQQPMRGFWMDTPALVLTIPASKTPLRAEDLYPDVPFLTNSEQTQLYLKSRINRELIRQIVLSDRWKEALRTRLKDFKRAQVKITPEPKDNVTWLAKQIAPEISYLLLGEVHEEPAVAQAIHTFLKEIHKQQPEREIFFFTEFIDYPTHEIVNNDFYQEMFAKLEADKSLSDIPVIGLEKEIPATEKDIFVGSQYNPLGQDFGASTEGMRLRNNYWLKVLQKYRAENPDALFIVYAGTAHIGYPYPHSLGAALQGPQTLAVSFHPDDTASPFDSLTKNTFFSEPILQFNDKELSRLSGFDVHLKVPTPPQEK